MKELVLTSVRRVEGEPNMVVIEATTSRTRHQILVWPDGTLAYCCSSKKRDLTDAERAEVLMLALGNPETDPLVERAIRKFL